VSYARDLRVADLMREVFSGPREARSPEYQAGVRAVFEYRVSGFPIVCPYSEGTAARDAFHAGCSEGHAEWRVRGGEVAA